jgi:hypothetical protein
VFLVKSFIASRKFTLQDQQLFAEFSGDFNPIHLSDEYARKTPPGKVIVHGINSLLWALDVFRNTGDNILDHLFVKFLQPIYLDETVDCNYYPDTQVIEISNTDVIFLRLKLSGNTCIYANSMGYSKSNTELEVADLDFNDIESLKRIKFIQSADPSYVKDLYPALFASYGCSLVSQISCLSSVVGMQAPGLHSIFVSAALNLKKKNNVQSIEVIKTDRRFSLVDLRVNTVDMEAKLRAIVRPMPIESLSLTALNKKITKRFAAGKRVLVVGGSRGLGSYTVKILALMGAAVTFSYAKGLRDAELLKKELEDANINANFVHFDIIAPNFCELFDSEPDYVFYFATPKIFVKRSKVFEQELYSNFKLFYVDAFKTILEKCVSRSVKGVFYPSSVAVVDETKELPEYIQAKLEGESLCKEYDNRNDFMVLVSRLPRTLTDQTATHLTIESEAPFDVLMPIFEEFL